MIAAVLVRLRAAIPGLPIDGASFPAPLDQANLLFDWRGVICPLAERCRPDASLADIPTVRSVPGLLGYAQGSLIPLRFFGQIKAGAWDADAPVYRRDAYRGQAPAAAWLRSDGQGNARAALCDNAMRPGMKLFDAHGGSTAVTEEQIDEAVAGCLLAILGAPASPAHGWIAAMWGAGQETVPLSSRFEAVRRLYR